MASKQEMNRTEISHIKTMAAAFARSIRWVGKIPATIITLINIPVSTLIDGDIFRSGILCRFQQVGRLDHQKVVVKGNERIKLLDRIWKLKRDGYPIVLSRAAYVALRKNNWKRPIPQIELGTNEHIFKCCHDVDNTSVCKNCGYANCVEISQILDMKPSALWQFLRLVM
jgi:hypothetical protein